MAESRKRLLVVISAAPYSSSRARDALDFALTAAAFEIPLSLLFCGDGAYQLVANQQPAGIEQKDLSATLPVLPLYDVERIYVEEDALTVRNIAADSLAVSATALDTDEIRALFHQHDQVLSF